MKQHWLAACLTCGIAAGAPSPAVLDYRHHMFDPPIMTLANRSAEVMFDTVRVEPAGHPTKLPKALHDLSFTFELNGTTHPAVPDSVFVIPNESTPTQVTSRNELIAKTLLTVSNYPNPFNPATQVSFSVEMKGMASLKVYDVLGREVAELFHDVAQPGQVYTRSFAAAHLSSGVYFSVLQSGAQRAVHKMLLTK